MGQKWQITILGPRHRLLLAKWILGSARGGSIAMNTSVKIVMTPQGNFHIIHSPYWSGRNRSSWASMHTSCPASSSSSECPDQGQELHWSTGTYASVLPKAGLPPQTQEPTLQFYQGLNKCGTFPLLSAPHSLFSISTDLKTSEKIPGAPTWRWGEWIWLTGNSPKFTIEVKYQFHQSFFFLPDHRSENSNHPSPPVNTYKTIILPVVLYRCETFSLLGRGTEVRDARE